MTDSHATRTIVTDLGNIAFSISNSTLPSLRQSMLILPLSIWRFILQAGACIEDRVCCSGRITGCISPQ
jgi:hypothetical protein